MEGVIALMIPIVAVGGFFIWMLSLSPVGKAYAEKVRGGPRRDADREDLREALDGLRQEVSELAERVDFTERLLAKQQDSARLERPK